MRLSFSYVLLMAASSTPCAWPPGARKPSCARGLRFARARPPRKRTLTNRTARGGRRAKKGRRPSDNNWARPGRACRTRAPTTGPPHDRRTTTTTGAPGRPRPTGRLVGGGGAGGGGPRGTNHATTWRRYDCLVRCERIGTNNNRRRRRGKYNGGGTNNDDDDDGAAGTGRTPRNNRTDRRRRRRRNNNAAAVVFVALPTPHDRIPPRSAHARGARSCPGLFLLFFVPSGPVRTRIAYATAIRKGPVRAPPLPPLTRDFLRADRNATGQKTYAARDNVTDRPTSSAFPGRGTTLPGTRHEIH